MVLIEGLGDEVTYALLIVLIIAILSLAWISTGVQPFNYYVWLVQLQTWPQRRVLQVMHVDERTADRLETEMAGDGGTTTWRVPTESGRDTPVETHAFGQLPRIQLEIEEVNPLTPSSSNQQTRPVDDPQDQADQSDRSVGHPPSDDPQESQSPGDTRIKLKFLDDTHKMVAAWLSQTVGEFKREHFTPAVHDGKVVRLIYQGQLLRDEGRSLASYGLHDNCIVHCHVSTTPYQHERPTTEEQTGESGEYAGVHIGRYIYVIFTLKFAALWFGFALYPDYFDFASFFSLVMCTVVYVLFAYTSYRTREPRIPPRSRPLTTPAISRPSH